MVLCSPASALDGVVKVFYEVDTEVSFKEVDLITITTQVGQWAVLKFFKDEIEILKVRISEDTGENDGNIDLVYLNHSPDHLHFDWRDETGLHKFRSNKHEWDHYSGTLGTILAFTFGYPLTFKIILKEITCK